MYRVPLTTAVVEALSTVFDGSYPNPDFANLRVSIEFPLERQDYPSIWLTFDDRDELEIVSIDHREYITGTDGAQHELTRWKFSGTFTLTLVALSSRERDALYDEMVRVFAFSRTEENNLPGTFRHTIESNDFVAVAVNWDQLRPFGASASPGTPWGTEDEVLYEISLSFDVLGEFLSAPSTLPNAVLSAVLVQGVRFGEPPVQLPDMPVLGGDAVPFTPHAWH